MLFLTVFSLRTNTFWGSGSNRIHPCDQLILLSEVTLRWKWASSSIHVYRGVWVGGPLQQIAFFFLGISQNKRDNRNGLCNIFSFFFYKRNINAGTHNMCTLILMNAYTHTRISRSHIKQVNPHMLIRSCSCFVWPRRPTSPFIVLSSRQNKSHMWLLFAFLRQIRWFRTSSQHSLTILHMMTDSATSDCHFMDSDFIFVVDFCEWCPMQHHWLIDWLFMLALAT